MKVVEWELKRYNAKVKEFRKAKDEALTLSREEAGLKIQAERNKIAKVLKKQERVLFGKKMNKAFSCFLSFAQSLRKSESRAKNEEIRDYQSIDSDAGSIQS